MERWQAVWRDLLSSGRSEDSWSSPAERRRYEYINVALIGSAVFAPIFSILSIGTGQVVAGLLGFVALAAALLMAWMLRRWRILDVAGHVFVAAFTVSCWVSLYELGGLRSADYGWNLLPGALAVLLISVRAGVAWGMLNMLLTLGLGWLHRLNKVPEPLPLEGNHLYLSFTAMGAVAVMLWLLAVFRLQVHRAEQIAAETIHELDAEVVERRRAEQSAKDALDARKRFLALMSHEIRTPVNGVVGIGRVLLQTELSAEQQRLVETSVGASETLLAVLNDLLEFSRNEAVQLEMAPAPVSLRALVGDSVELYRSSAEAKGLQLRVEIADDAPDWCSLDATRLRQVVGNLVSNAVKFTRTGGVVVRLRDLDGAVSLEVQDTGIGLVSEQRERLFEPFTQADSSTAREFGGTGLGLAICHQIIHAMHGRIEVESELGAGALFRVVFPFHSATPTPVPESAPAEPLAGLRVLVAEDNAANAVLMEKLLALGGHEAVLVCDGHEAVARAAQGFDVVLMDLRMPGMDGLEATRRIRAEHGRTLPIIAITANVMDEDRAACLEAGVDEFLPKPFRAEELWDALRRCLAR